MKEFTTNREEDTIISTPRSEAFSLWWWIITDVLGEDARVEIMKAFLLGSAHVMFQTSLFSLFVGLLLLSFSIF